jgi:nicotinamidase-related amidase
MAVRCAEHSRLRGVLVAIVILAECAMVDAVMAAEDMDSFDLRLCRQPFDPTADGGFRRQYSAENWPAAATAIIVCDVWDYHHCLNAVRRLEEFAPRLDAVLAEARRRGATIIHAPSDCMPAYADHPARIRAMSVPMADTLPDQIGFWCSAIPAEEAADYPIDQSDGGEDDDPAEHAAWAAKLEALGRNPAMPWQRQSPLITIDEQDDFLTDRGDEVWNILEARGIDRVILTGVHVNMCVLGRPFGLRQLARNGKQVVLMRDMTDAMYNPARWPYVSHFEGTRRVIDHVERHVCPTVTSDQIIGGDPFRFAGDSARRSEQQPSRGPDWQTVSFEEMAGTKGETAAGWYRCTIFLPQAFLPEASDPAATTADALRLDCSEGITAAWLNGKPLLSALASQGSSGGFRIGTDQALADEVNLLVVHVSSAGSPAPVLRGGGSELRLAGRWQRLMTNVDEPWTMPLPPKFGASPEVLHSMETAARR